MGLLDGEGSIQVNHWRKTSLQYRIVIKLKWNEANEKMLQQIAEVVGGTVRQDGNFIIWVENNREKIKKILNILEKIPPLTTRLRAQIAFIHTCLKHNNVEEYIKTRDNKYDNRQQYKPKGDIKLLDYWSAWLSGFIEAEGCFSIRKTGIKSFSIGQKYENYLIAEIKSYFQLTCVLRLVKSKVEEYYSIETYNKESLDMIKKHFDKNPLIGEKTISYKNFYFE